MWRTGDSKTSAHYRHVGDTMKNRARAIHAWFGEFAQKLNDFPGFAGREQRGGERWYGDMSTFDKVKQRLQGCRPFAWYLRRFKTVYEDAGIIPPDIFMLKEESSGLCIRFMGNAGTSGAGRERVKFGTCDDTNHRFFWHLGNVDRRTGACCSGFRAWNTEQCFQGASGTGICEITGTNMMQQWRLTSDGLLQHTNGRCVGSVKGSHEVKEGPCISLRSGGGGKFSKVATRVPLERELYEKAMAEHPEMFRLLNQQLGLQQKPADATCGGGKGTCVALALVGAPGASEQFRCLDSSGGLVSRREDCAPVIVVKGHVKEAVSGDCLDTWSDSDDETWGFYPACHDGDNQKFVMQGPSRVCSPSTSACFASHPWPLHS